MKYVTPATKQALAAQRASNPGIIWGMSFFRDAEIVYEGRTISFSKKEAEQFDRPGTSWHAEGDPSSWLVVEILREAYRRTRPAPVEFAYVLAARVLGIEIGAVYNAITWHENYMRWHDGDSSYSVL
jgi:hypothetical protein